VIKRVLKRFSIGLLGLLFSVILIVAVTSWLLLGTATGNRWLLGQVSGLIPGELQVDDWQGSLLDRVSATGVRYQLDDLSVSLDRLEVELVPASLARGWLEFTTLSVGNLRLSLPPGQASDDSPAGKLPDSLALPMGVRIDTLSLASLHLNDTLLVSELDARQLAAWRRFQLASLTTRTVADISVEATAQGSLAAPGTCRYRRAIRSTQTDWQASLISAALSQPCNCATNYKAPWKFTARANGGSASPNAHWIWNISGRLSRCH